MDIGRGRDKNHVATTPLRSDLARMSWNCQRCAQPLQLDASLVGDDRTLNRAKDVVLEAFPDFNSEEAPDLSKRLAALDIDNGLRDVLRMQMTQCSTPRGSVEEENNDTQRLDELFHLLSALPMREHQPIQHPICDACTQQLHEHVSSLIDDARKERDTLQMLERELVRLALLDGDLEMSAEDEARWQRKQDAVLQEINEVRERLIQMDSEKERLKSELFAYEEEKFRHASELKHVHEEEQALQEEEDQFWRAYNEETAELQQMETKRSQVETQLRNGRMVLEQLEQSSAYHDVFCIEEDTRGMASINGLRLGRYGGSYTPVSGEQIEWPEINAAYGQTALLLTVLSRKLDCTFSRYKVVPRGSFSTVERLDHDQAVYELYGTNDWYIGRIMHSRRFDYALSGMLCCTEELCHKVQSLDASWEQPYAYVICSRRIQKETIGGASIRLQFNQPDTWTRANRYLLLTYASILPQTSRAVVLDPRLAPCVALPIVTCPRPLSCRQRGSSHVGLSCCRRSQYADYAEWAPGARSFA